MSGLPETITLPAGVDIHAHLREPSPINKSETFESGTRAALMGGYIAVCDMPNTPGRPTWSYNAVLEKQELISRDALAYVGIIAGHQPGESDIHQLASLADTCIALKLYFGKTTGNEDLDNIQVSDYEDAVASWHKLAPGKLIMVHRGEVHLEEIIDLIARKYEHPTHICHVHDPEEVKIVTKAKTEYLNVTCGVCPHHLIMTEEDVNKIGWFARMQPPLSSPADSEQLWYQLINKSIDIIETDHAPHPAEVKEKFNMEDPDDSKDLDHKPYGVPSLEVAQPLMFKKAGTEHRERVVEALSKLPAERLGIRLSSQAKATWEMKEYEIEERHVSTNCGWLPYLGQKAIGEAVLIKTAHNVLMRKGEILDRPAYPILSRGQMI